MGSTITVRGIDPADESWLGREARRGGVSVEEVVRRLIRERRAKAERSTKPSEVFRRYFGPEHGVELPPRPRYGYRPIEFPGEHEA